MARVPELRALCADLSPLQLVKTRIPCEDRPCFLFSLVPPPNLSETFENKILFVPPPHNAAVDCRRAVPDGAQGGEGLAKGGERCSAEKAEVAANNLPAARFSLAGFIPARTGSRRIWGLGVVMGEGTEPRSSRVLPEAPRAEGEGRQAGGRGRGGCGGEDGRANPIHTTGQLGASSKAGRTGSLNFPSVCWGRGARRAGSYFSRFAPSPPRLSAHMPSPGLEAGCGAAGRGVGGALSIRFGRGERKLANEGQKGWGRRKYFFF